MSSHPDKACLMCRHCRLDAPPDWKPDTNSAFRDEVFRLSDEVQRLRTGGDYRNGWCTLYPEWQEVSEGHYCGQFKHVQRRRDRATVEEFIYGSWHAQRYERAEEQNRKLRHELAQARKISASRLARLRKVKE